MSAYHTPVLLEESVQLLAVEPQGTYADLTFGGGGHSRRILAELGDGGRLFAFDQDRDTHANRPDDPRFHFVESNFRFLSTAYWPTWGCRRTISTRWSAVFRSAAKLPWTCA